MASIAFPSHAKLLTLPNGRTYNYVLIPCTSPLPTILFIHGFPSSSWDWRHQISHFSQRGYGVLAPDLLGYGGTSKPTTLSPYRGKAMASDLVSILDAEKISKVHGVGHDFGCWLLSRLVNYHPERLYTSSFLSVPYLKPGGHFDADAINAMMVRLVGYEKYGYVKFFGQENAAALLKAHRESWFRLFYPHDPELWIEHMRPTGAIEKWVSSDHMAPLASFITEEERDMHHRIFQGDYEAPLRWYKSSMLGNCDEEEEKEAIAGGMSVKVDIPVLVIVEKGEKGEMMDEGGLKELCQDVRVVRTSTTNHWVQLECRDEVNKFLREVLEGVKET